MPELKTWGVVWTEAIPYSARWECENPGCCWEPTMGLKFYDQMVGFVHEPFVRRDQQIVGKMIVECPRCFSTFWFHMHEENAKYMMNSKNWPKESTGECHDRK